MGKIDLKDKRNVYAIAISLLIMVAAHLVYNYMWDPYVYQRESLERELESAQAELNKINAKKHDLARLEMELVQAEKDF
jgi:type IV pilus assembly protein PilO